MRLADLFDAFLVDLDGVVWRGDEPIPGAPETVAALRKAGKRVVFVTNNASRSPRDYAAKLMRLRLPTPPSDIVTSAHALVGALRELGLGAGARVHVCGTDALASFLAAQRFVPTKEPEAEAVVVAWNRSLSFDDLARAADAARSGIPFFAANRDATYPSAEGLLPGTGAILAAVEVASGRRARVVGKPEPVLVEEALGRAGVAADRALVVGDRADTDVAAARAAGVRVALVLTGVTTEPDLGCLPLEPDWILPSLGALLDTSEGLEDRLAPPPPEGNDEDGPEDEASNVGEVGDTRPLIDLS